jgi:hypothetical protein
VATFSRCYERHEVHAVFAPVDEEVLAGVTDFAFFAPSQSK